MGPGLFEFNLASHLVWWVGGGMVGVLGVIGLAELVSWLREALRGSRGADPQHRA